MGHDPVLATVTALPVDPEAGLPFDEFLLARGLAAKTVVDYVRVARGAVDWFEANGLDLADPLPSELRAYADTLPNTTGVRSHLRSALKYWWLWRGVPGWPEAIRLPKAPVMECKALDDSEARALVEVARGWWRPGTAMLCLVYLGLRNQELAAMRWDGFDGPMEWYTLVGKNNRQRTVPVHRELVCELDDRRDGSPWIFEGRFGGPISHTTVWNWVRAVAERAGLESTSMWPHRIRHTVLARMNDETGDLRTVQTFAGHSRPETTAGYTRTTRERLRAASDSLDW